jgi:GNAT superfamily N-acetyltransferase
MNERVIRTRDGGRFVVRPMTAEDADAVLAGFDRLSPTSLRYRFFSPVPRITPGVADDLVRIDPASRIVLLAFTDDGRLAGGARAVRHRDDPATADVAVTVGDPFQRRGLGSKLLKLLGTAALAEGIDRLAGHVLVDNPGGRGLLIANGAVCRLDEPGVLAFEIPLGRHRTVAPAVAQRRHLGLAS